MPIKIAMWYYYMPRGITKIQNNKTFKCIQGFSINRMHILLVGMQTVKSTLENYLVLFPNLK